MEWLNLHTSTLDSPEFVGADPTDRATWLCLLRYCIGQENGGVIIDCASWPDRRWQQICRVTKKETQVVCDLWKWEGSTLLVWAYPLEKQGQVQRLRGIGSVSSPAKIAAAKANGSLGGRPANNPSHTQQVNPTGTQQETHEKPIEGKGKEGKGKEGKRKGREAMSPAAQGQSARGQASPARPADAGEAVEFFAAEGSNAEQAATFFDHYTANGWKQGGKTAIRDWRAAARNWIRRAIAGQAEGAIRSGLATRGAAAGLGGHHTQKNLGGRGGAVERTEEFIKLPVVGIDIGADEVAELEGDK